MNVIVLAGDKKNKTENVISVNDQSFDCKNTGYIPDNKAFIKIKNKYMIEYVIDTLKKCSNIEKIAVVGPVDRLTSIIGNKVDYIIEGADSIITNGLLALEKFKADKEILIVTSDIPMITVEALEDFIQNAQKRNADLCYSIVNKKVNDEKYPGVRRTYARLWEGQFTGGNVFLFNPAAADRCKDFMEKMLEYRKSPAKMAGMLGIVFLLKLAMGILTINAVQKKCEKLLGIKGAAVISQYPEIGNDVDKISDIALIEKFIVE